MADNTVLNAGSGGDTLATDDIGGVKHQRVKVEHGLDGSATDASAADPFPVALGLVAPKSALGSSTGLAAGASVDLDGAQVSADKTGKLVAVLLTASVALRGELQTVQNGVPSAAKAVVFTPPGNARWLRMPSKEFFTVPEDAQAGFDGFRMRVTNLDPTQAADVYATFLWDEV